MLCSYGDLPKLLDRCCSDNAATLQQWRRETDVIWNQCCGNDVVGVMLGPTLCGAPEFAVLCAPCWLVHMSRQSSRDVCPCSVVANVATMCFVRCCKWQVIISARLWKFPIKCIRRSLGSAEWHFNYTDENTIIVPSVWLWFDGEHRSEYILFLCSGSAYVAA